MATTDANSAHIPEGLSDADLDALMEEMIEQVAIEDGEAVTTQANDDGTEFEDDADNELDSLDALMAESLEAVAEKQKLKIAREKQRRGGLSAKEQAENDAWLARWEMQNIWKPAANVAMYKSYKCDCGRKQTIFHQLLQRQTHRHNAQTQRWIDTEVQLTNLPNEIVVQKWTTPQCTYCSAKAGFDFTTAPVTEWNGN